MFHVSGNELASTATYTFKTKIFSSSFEDFPKGLIEGANLLPWTQAPPVTGIESPSFATSMTFSTIQVSITECQVMHLHLHVELTYVLFTLTIDC